MWKCNHVCDGRVIKTQLGNDPVGTKLSFANLRGSGFILQTKQNLTPILSTEDEVFTVNWHYIFSFMVKDQNKRVMQTRVGDSFDFCVQGPSQILDSEGDFFTDIDGNEMWAPHSLMPLPENLEDIVLSAEVLPENSFKTLLGGPIVARLFETSCGLTSREGGYKVGVL